MTKLLIVDDSKFSQKITRSFLDRYLDDVTFDFADDGQAGLEKFDAWHPDYIIVDLLMPKLRGQDMIKQVKLSDPDARVIVLSADVQHHVREEVESLGVLTFVNKPLDDKKARELGTLIGKSSRG
ncbi:response regulator transcription factor [Sporolactobacillus terrae]|uniref:Response regulator n=1 Tax=Sporolactobacillus terrae TaxID=269673 RepID=A0A410DAW9_9BACL|nr:response regulator [Sporolactobacillus terrae]QAA23273.1 response regulator [Sporolactobacillus terrae]QAA26245.1 response regulator [Sporolactobacillus terrae]UAK15341.1 response regulator [Sporolactobacillus terrae]BBN99679.1 two-component system response regulator [Sporolactobacillus terrae]